MKTDPLFYELFQAAPQTFFELLQTTPPCPYRFESITVKSSEKRIDGVLEPANDGKPFYFLEVQAFPDPTIYWRVMREVSTFFEQRPQLEKRPWQAIVLWLNIEDNPGFGTLGLLGRKPRPRLLALDLIDVLKKLPETSLARNVLQPLLVETEVEVRQHVVQWVENIRQTPNLDQRAEETLVAVMSQLIEQKFKTLSYKELSQMLRLTPLAETTSGQELIKEERTRILAELIQVKFNALPEVVATIHNELQQLSLDNLKLLTSRLLLIPTIEQLEVWISEHLPQDQA